MLGLCETLTIILDASSINLAWENTTTGCTLRQLLLDCYITQIEDFEHVEGRWADYDEGFLQELMVRLHGVARQMYMDNMDDERMDEPHQRNRC